MVGGSRIIAFGSGGQDPSEPDPVQEEAGNEAVAADFAEDASVDDGAWVEVEQEYEEPARSALEWWPAALAILLAAGWTGFFAWANWSRMIALPPPQEIASLISGWAAPVLLIGIVWLIAMRSSTREASRFGDAARLLSRESAELESRLVTVNRELSLAREFLASETRDLDALGRMAGDRLSEHAQRLQELVRENGERVETIGTVSGTALENMEKLRGQLPVIASSAKDVTNNIASAGRTAHAQLQEMVNGFKRINEFGVASEQQVLSLRGELDKTFESFSGRCDQIADLASRRFAEIAQRSDEVRTELETQEIAALAAIRDRASALSEELGEARTRLEEQESASLETLRERIAALRDEGGTISRNLRESETTAIDTWRTSLGEIEAQRSALFGRLEEADSSAVEMARSRMASIEEEARLIEAGVAERTAKLDEELAKRREDAEQAEKQAISRLAEMLAALDGELSQRAHEHDRISEGVVTRAQDVLDRLGEFDAGMNDITRRAGESEQRLTGTVEAIAERIEAVRTSLTATESDLATLNESSIRIFELVQASEDKAREALPAALGHSQERLAAFEGLARAMSAELDRASENSRYLSNQVEASGTALSEIVDRIAESQHAIRNHSNACDEALRDHANTLAELDSKSEALTEKMREELAASLASLEASAREAVSSFSEQGSEHVNDLARQLGDASADAIDKAMRAKAAEATGQLEQAAAHAAGVSREATIQLRDQLAKVDELAGNLEQRVALARERAEEQVDNDFARRAALITEALNSNAIDIAKALSTDVSDTSWEGYLRGDRGIFTRRAVSLIESAEGKAIQQIFERDPDFREHVNRYIHDFEAILRQVLSTRDGNALGVTLLSSDMGKLYVALAQSIERLRT